MKDVPGTSYDDPNRPLWDRYRRDRGQEPKGEDQAEIDLNALAAYLDGTADQATVDQIETRLLSDPQMLETIRELRLIRDDLQKMPRTTPPAVQRVITVVNAAPSQASAATDPSDRSAKAAQPTARLWWSGLQWAAAAGLMLAVGLAGYEAGTGSYTTGRPANPGSATVAGDLGQWLEAPALPLIAFVNGGGP